MKSKDGCTESWIEKQQTRSENVKKTKNRVSGKSSFKSGEEAWGGWPLDYEKGKEKGDKSLKRKTGGRGLKLKGKRM